MMMKLKDIERKLNYMGMDCGLSVERTQNGQKLLVHRCLVGENFYDYGDDKPKKWDYSRFPELENDPRIEWIECPDCCACAGW